MTIEPEIKDTPEDRAAMAILLPFAIPNPGPIWNEIDATPLDAAWFALARELAECGEDRIDTILTAIEKARDRKGGSNIAKLGVERAAELMGLIVDWRHRRWVNQEVLQGRDPYRLAVP